MRYSINYFGAYYSDDTEGCNTHYYSRWEDAVAELYGLHGAGVPNVVLKDEEYDCSLSWDERDGEFCWY